MDELIDKVAFRDHWNKNYRHQYANDTFLFAIANFPTVDAVPVVRCKDCKKRYKPNECPMCILVYGEQHDFTQENGYCDRGERRTDD